MKSIGVPGRLLVAGTVFAALVACSDADNNAPTGQTQMDHEMAMPDEALMARIVADDAEYLVQLGLMRGHLFVGNQLYLLGELAEAVTHMKHPESELYAEGSGIRGAGRGDTGSLPDIERCHCTGREPR